MNKYKADFNAFRYLCKNILPAVLENLSHEYFGLNHLIIKIVFYALEGYKDYDPSLFIIDFQDSFNLQLYPHVNAKQLNIFMQRFCICKDVR